MKNYLVRFNYKETIFWIFMYIIEQYKSAGISPWNNNWGNIHDFTTMSDGKNYSLLDQVIEFELNKNLIFIFILIE